MVPHITTKELCSVMLYFRFIILSKMCTGVRILDVNHGGKNCVNLMITLAVLCPLLKEVHNY